MPCYIHTVQPPSQQEYQLWQSIGYLGSYDDYIAIKQGNVGMRLFMCGEHLDLGKQCADCAEIGDYLCDFPVGDGKTCDRTMCAGHAHEIAPEIHYCAAHYRMWMEFKQAGGIDATLRNVIPFERERPPA